MHLPAVDEMAASIKQLLQLLLLLLLEVVLCSGSECVCDSGEGTNLLNSTNTLSLAVFIPLTTTDLVGAKFLPSLEIGLQLINNRSDLLPDYTVEAVIADSNVGNNTFSCAISKHVSSLQVHSRSWH